MKSDPLKETPDQFWHDARKNPRLRLSHPWCIDAQSRASRMARRRMARLGCCSSAESITKAVRRSCCVCQLQPRSDWIALQTCLLNVSARQMKKLQSCQKVEGPLMTSFVPQPDAPKRQEEVKRCKHRLTVCMFPLNFSASYTDLHGA